MTSDMTPKVGSEWQHYNGVKYTVLTIANRHSEDPTHPPTVVYVGPEWLVWARPLDTWAASFTEVEYKERTKAEQLHDLRDRLTGASWPSRELDAYTLDVIDPLPVKRWPFTEDGIADVATLRVTGLSQDARALVRAALPGGYYIEEDWYPAVQVCHARIRYQGRIYEAKAKEPPFAVLLALVEALIFEEEGK